MAYEEKDIDGRLQSTKLTANDSTAQLPIGTIRRLEDGRAFRYVQMTVGALAIGQLVKAAAVVDIDDLSTADGVGPDGATTTIVTKSGATWTPDAYVGWYFKADTGGGGTEEAIKIVGNSATTLTLEKSIGTDMTADDDGEIVAPLGVVIITTTTTATQKACGVGIGTITQDYFGWVQIRGYANVLATTGLTETKEATPGGATTPGQAADSGGTTDYMIGWCVAAGGNNKQQLIYLNIAE